MNYLGIDYGEKRIGLSYGDSEVRLAVPIAAAVQTTFAARMEQIAEVIRQRRIGELVVGYPYNMDGSIGFKAKEVDAFIEKLVGQFGLPVHRSDERLTSSDAQARMSEAGRSRRLRGKQSIRAKLAERKSGVLDSRAATLILQDYLDALAGGITFLDGEGIGLPDEEDATWPDGGDATLLGEKDAGLSADGLPEGGLSESGLSDDGGYGMLFDKKDAARFGNEFEPSDTESLFEDESSFTANDDSTRRGRRKGRGGRRQND